MFRFEKDMIPVLTKKLSEKYRTNLYVNEFNSGNGIADLVFALWIDFNGKPDSFMEYNLIYILVHYLNRRNKKIHLKTLQKEISLSKKEVDKMVDFLVKFGILEIIDEGTFIVKNIYSPPIKKIISIEAKLHDWKGGFYQALRYKTYSHKSYLAISSDYVHRVDMDLLREHNIGLISVSIDSLTFVLDAKAEEPNSKTSYAYLSQKMAHALTCRTYKECSWT